MTIPFIKHVTKLMLLPKGLEFQSRSMNQMKSNTCECHLILLILHTEVSNQIQIESSLIKSSLCEKLLDVEFDHQLTFDQHVKSSCKK